MTQTIMGDKNIQIGLAGAVNIYVSEIEAKTKPQRRGSRQRRLCFRQHLLDFIDGKIKEAGTSREAVLAGMSELGHQLTSFHNLTEWDLFDVAMYVDGYYSGRGF